MGLGQFHMRNRDSFRPSKGLMLLYTIPPASHQFEILSAALIFCSSSSQSDPDHDTKKAE